MNRWLSRYRSLNKIIENVQKHSTLLSKCSKSHGKKQTSSIYMIMTVRGGEERVKAGTIYRFYRFPVGFLRTGNGRGWRIGRQGVLKWRSRRARADIPQVSSCPCCRRHGTSEVTAAAARPAPTSRPARCS